MVRGRQEGQKGQERRQGQKGQERQEGGGDALNAFDLLDSLTLLVVSERSRSQSLSLLKG